jgi:S1-C subfamily serine protease
LHFGAPLVVAAGYIASGDRQAETHSGEDTTNVWKELLEEKVIPAVVALKINVPINFDTSTCGSAVATGFVVDAKNGIILTNRHVVNPGPVVAEAVFQNNEEVPVTAIYRDPVHDFGFFKYDPAHLRYMQTKELKLNPDAARVGTDIRVVGNDAAEKLCIAAGTLARLDRNAPVYSSNGYNDFNTFYMQASSGTTGGSSGSPVLNSKGEVIGLNAGGKRGTNAAFYLPLPRVKRALELLQRGEAVSRGSLQTVFLHRPFDELKRLGLSTATEEMVRQSDGNVDSMLVVSETVPGGPAHGILQPGDVLVRVNGSLVTTFVPLEAILDGALPSADSSADPSGDESGGAGGVGGESAGKVKEESAGKVTGKVRLQVERGGERVDFELDVTDLHAVSPSQYLTAGGGTFTPLSYQQARNFAVDVSAGGVYVSDPGYFLHNKLGRGSLIRAMGGEDVKTLEDFERVYEGLEDGEMVSIKFSAIDRPTRLRTVVVKVDKRWFGSRICHREDIHTATRSGSESGSERGSGSSRAQAKGGVHKCDSAWVCRNFGVGGGQGAEKGGAGSKKKKQPKAGDDPIKAQFPPGGNKVR